MQKDVQFPDVKAPLLLRPQRTKELRTCNSGAGSPAKVYAAPAIDEP
jgi:hypothetical protein